MFDFATSLKLTYRCPNYLILRKKATLWCVKIPSLQKMLSIQLSYGKHFSSLTFKRNCGSVPLKRSKYTVQKNEFETLNRLLFVDLYVCCC